MEPSGDPNGDPSRGLRGDPAETDISSQKDALLEENRRRGNGVKQMKTEITWDGIDIGIKWDIDVGNDKPNVEKKNRRYL